ALRSHGERIELAGAVEARPLDRARDVLADVHARPRGQLVKPTFGDGDRFLSEPYERHGGPVPRSHGQGNAPAHSMARTAARTKRVKPNSATAATASHGRRWETVTTSTIG